MIQKTFLLLFCLVIFTSTAHAQSAIETTAKQAIVIDYDTGTVLLQKNADERMPTSSMSKVMTAYVVFDALKNGKLSLDQQLPVSERAWRMQGSKMFVDVGKQVKLEDLIRGVIIQSGNDATIVIAEGMAGTEEAFAALMNKKAKELGMDHSHFMNASGWPDPEHYSTARDLAILARALIKNFPDQYKYYSEIDFTYNNIKQGNRNPLLYKNIGADGVKTGHTEAGGYGLIGSGMYEGRRVIFVVNGLADEKVRAQEATNILEWGLKNFQSKKFFKSGDTVENAAVVLGTSPFVPMVVKQDIGLTLPKINADNYKVTIRYKEPLEAPVKAGDELGTLEIELPATGQITAPLYAGEDVPRVGFIAGAMEKIRLYLNGGKAG